MARGKYRRQRERRLRLAQEQQSIDHIGLSPHIVKLLPTRTFGDLRKLTEDELLQIKGIGPASVKQIQECISSFPKTTTQLEKRGDDT